MTKKKDEAGNLERLALIDQIIHDELLAMTDSEIAEIALPGDAEIAAALLAQTTKALGKQRLAHARAAVRTAQPLTTSRPPARPSAQSAMVTLAARHARPGSSADQPGIDDDLAELEADRERDRDHS